MEMKMNRKIILCTIPLLALLGALVASCLAQRPVRTDHPRFSASWWLAHAAGEKRLLDDISRLQALQGNLGEAIRTAHSIEHPRTKAYAFARLAEIATDQGQPQTYRECIETAKAAALEVPAREGRNRALTAVAKAQVHAGEAEAARNTVRRINDSGDQKRMMEQGQYHVARALILKGQTDAAMEMADSLPPNWQGRVFEAVAAARAKAGEPAAAREMLGRITDPYMKRHALLEMAKALADGEESAGYREYISLAKAVIKDEAKANSDFPKWMCHWGVSLSVKRGELAEAKEFARMHPRPREESRALCSIALAMSKANDPDGYKECIKQARAAVARIDDHNDMWDLPRSAAYEVIAETQIKAGDIQGAIATAHAIGLQNFGGYWKAKAYARIALALSEAGDVAGYKASVKLALAAAKTLPEEQYPIVGAYTQDAALMVILKAQAEAGDIDGAEESFRELDKFHHKSVSHFVAAAMAEAGNMQEAYEWIRKLKTPEARARSYLAVAEAVLEKEQAASSSKD